MLKVVLLFFKTPPLLPTLPFYGKNMGVGFQPWGAVTFKTKLYVKTANSFQPLPIFCHKELHLRCHIGLELNIVTWTQTTVTWSTHSMIEKKLTLLDALKTNFQIFFCIKLSFLHLLSNGLNGVNINSFMSTVTLL